METLHLLRARYADAGGLLFVVAGKARDVVLDAAATDGALCPFPQFRSSVQHRLEGVARTFQQRLLGGFKDAAAHIACHSAHGLAYAGIRRTALRSGSGLLCPGRAFLSRPGGS